MPPRLERPSDTRGRPTNEDNDTRWATRHRLHRAGLSSERDRRKASHYTTQQHQHPSHARFRENPGVGFASPSEHRQRARHECHNGHCERKRGPRRREHHAARRIRPRIQPVVRQQRNKRHTRQDRARKSRVGQRHVQRTVGSPRRAHASNRILRRACRQKQLWHSSWPTGSVHNASHRSSEHIADIKHGATLSSGLQCRRLADKCSCHRRHLERDPALWRLCSTSAEAASTPPKAHTARSQLSVCTAGGPPSRGGATSVSATLAHAPALDC